MMCLKYFKPFITRLVSTAFSLFLVLFFVSCSTEPKKCSFEIAYTGNFIAGYAPCKCPGSKDGGLPRRSSVLEYTHSDTMDCLFLDAGNFFGSGRDNVIERTELLLAGLQKLEIDAVNLAFRDITNPLEVIKRFEKEYQIPFLSANVIETATGQHPFPTYLDLTVGKSKMKVRVIGLAKGGPDRNIDAKNGMKLEEPFEALKRELANIPESIQYVVLLTEEHQNAINSWYKMFKDANLEMNIDMVISSSNRMRRTRKVLNVEDINMVATDRQGKYFDKITIMPDKNDKWNVDLTSIKLDAKQSQDEEMADFLVNKGKILGVPREKLETLKNPNQQLIIH